MCRAKQKTDLKIMAAIREEANQQTHASFMYGIVTAHCPWKLIEMKWQARGLQSAEHCNKAPERNIYVSLAKWQQMISVFQLDGATWNGCDKQARADSIMKCKFTSLWFYYYVFLSRTEPMRAGLGREGEERGPWTVSERTRTNDIWRVTLSPCLLGARAHFSTS